MVKKSHEQLNFEQNKQPLSGTTQHLATIALGLADHSIKLRSIDRKPRYPDGERENDVEHSFMLSLVAPELAKSLQLEMNYPLITEFAKVHELLETKTGDIPTFSINADQLAAKKQLEAELLPELLAELPPYHADLLERYESQKDPEARFVKFVDKLMPLLVDLLGQGERLMRQDYGIDTIEKLRAANVELDTRWRNLFGDEFPDILALHTLLCEMFEEKFSASS